MCSQTHGMQWPFLTFDDTAIEVESLREVRCAQPPPPLATSHARVLLLVQLLFFSVATAKDLLSLFAIVANDRVLTREALLRTRPFGALVRPASGIERALPVFAHARDCSQTAEEHDRLFTLMSGGPAVDAVTFRPFLVTIVLAQAAAPRDNAVAATAMLFNLLQQRGAVSCSRIAAALGVREPGSPPAATAAAGSPATPREEAVSRIASAAALAGWPKPAHEGAVRASLTGSARNLLTRIPSVLDSPPPSPAARGRASSLSGAAATATEEGQHAVVRVSSDEEGADAAHTQLLEGAVLAARADAGGGEGLDAGAFARWCQCPLDADAADAPQRTRLTALARALFDH